MSIELGWNVDKGITPSVELTETDYASNTAIIIGEVYRHKGEWKFAVKGEGISTGIDGLVARFN